MNSEEFAYKGLFSFAQGIASFAQSQYRRSVEHFVSATLYATTAIAAGITASNTPPTAHDDLQLHEELQHESCDCIRCVNHDHRFNWRWRILDNPANFDRKEPRTVAELKERVAQWRAE